jgi:ATP-dependent Zn protease
MKKNELVENLILKELDNKTRQTFDVLHARRNIEKPMVVFEKLRAEAANIVKDVKERKKQGEKNAEYKSDNPQVQYLIDCSNDEFYKLTKVVEIQSENVWGKAEYADIFRYCCEVGIIQDNYSSGSFKVDETIVPLTERPLYILKTLYPIRHDEITKLLSAYIPCPLKKLDDPKFAAKFQNMTLDMCNDFVDMAKYWGKEPKCNAILLYCRIMGYIDLPEVDLLQLKKQWLSDGNLSLLEEKARNRIFDLSSEVDKLQKYLLDTVKGQGQAIRLFCEGFFASEIFAAQKERKGTKGIFLFAGPPGTGKSYLAEQASKYLNRPCRVFNMTEYAGHEDQSTLIGKDYTWNGSHSGMLTTYVAENPNAILIFDEIEKAHTNTLHIFYDLLNSGTLEDIFMKTAKEAAEKFTLKTDDVPRRSDFLTYEPVISFKDTIIIFTSNAGRSLYEDGKHKNLSSIGKKTIINALETEINPLTNTSFFPAALISRIATGFPILFNHLKPRDLLEIIRLEYKSVAADFENVYGISMAVDDPDKTGETHNVLVSILLSEGGMADARTVKARASLFFKTAIHKSIQEIKFSQIYSLEKLKSFIFKVELDGQSFDIKNLFSPDSKARILLYASQAFARNCEQILTDYEFFYASTIEEAKNIAELKDIDFAIIDIINTNSDLASSVLNELKMTDNELPIYTLELKTNSTQVNQELILSYLRLGAFGNIVFSVYEDSFDFFGEQIDDIRDEVYMLKKVAELSRRHKTLIFNTKTEVDGETASIKFIDFELRRAEDADDLKGLMNDSNIPTERFSDVVGVRRAKEELQFYIDFLKKPSKFTVSGLKPPKGVLLYGPPGTGKTMLAKAMAGESGTTFIAETASNFHQLNTGSGPKAIRDLFARARKYAPSIIFIDEIDFIGKQRGSGNNSHINEETLNALLTEMDGFSTDPKRPVFVLAATNYDVETGKGGIGVIDEALSRRFDSTILVDLPNAEERKELIEKELNKIDNHAVTEEGIKNLAERSDLCRMNPSNLVATINEAKRTAFKKSVNDTKFLLNNDTLLEAFDVVTSGEENPFGEEYLERTARHEAGHALVYYLCGNVPSYITIVARNNYGGYMQHSLKDVRTPCPTKKQYLDKVRTSLGGYAAEFICYGDKDSDEGFSSGASSDLQNATNIVRNMITRFGMYEEFGLTVGAKESDELVKLINKILSEQLAKTKELIVSNRNMFDNIVTSLMNKKKLTEKEFEEICNGTYIC